MPLNMLFSLNAIFHCFILSNHFTDRVSREDKATGIVRQSVRLSVRFLSLYRLN